METRNWVSCKDNLQTPQQLYKRAHAQFSHLQNWEATLQKRERANESGRSL